MYNNTNLTKLSMNNYYDMFKKPMVRIGNNYYYNQSKPNEIKDLIPKPLSRYKDYKQFNIKF